MSEPTGIEKISFNFKDVILIGTIIISVVTNQLTIGSQVRELATKLEDSVKHQDQLTQSYRELINLQIKTIELRLDRIEQIQTLQTGKNGK